MGKYRITFDKDRSADRISFDIDDEDIATVDEAIDEAWRKLIHAKSGEWWYFGSAQELLEEDIVQIGVQLIIAYDDGTWLLEGWSVPVDYSKEDTVSIENQVNTWIRNNLSDDDAYKNAEHIGVHEIYEVVLDEEE